MKSTTLGHKRSMAALLLAGTVALAGCGDKSTRSTTSSGSTSQQSPQTYMSGVVLSDTNQTSDILTTFQIDDTAKTFAQTSFAGSKGSQLNASGTFEGLSRGLLSLKTFYATDLLQGTVTSYNPAQTGSWALELANQGGGLVQLKGQAVTPLAAAQSCPNYSSAQSFLFVTIPAPLASGGGQELASTWNPAYDAAYGSVDVTSNGETVNFKNIQQYTVTGSKLSTYPTLLNTPAAISSQSGTCSHTYYGNTVSVPTDATLTIGSGGNSTTSTPAAIVGIGPSGLMVESNGNGGDSGNVPIYQPFLGAGTGALGLPKPSSAISLSALTGAQYLGFFYGSGAYSLTSGSGWSSQVASFGFSSLPSSCQSVTAQTGNLIYGGDFANNDPGATAVQASGGYGNCNMAIDLGTQDPANNGLFPSAKVWVGTGFSGNAVNKTYSFPAVAIAGQVGGKYAIFLIGVDSTRSPNQAWGIYLMQSN